MIKKYLMATSGWLLFVSLLALSTLTLADDWYYTMRSGDNLWNLTERHLTSMRYVSRLQKLNRIQNPYTIPPGTRIRIPLAWTRQQLDGIRAHVVRVQGSVIVKRNNTSESIPVVNGMQLFVGDEIQSEDNAYVTVEFADKSHMRLQNNSSVRLSRLEIFGEYGLVDTLVELQYGRVESSVPTGSDVSTRFRIKTPSAISSVRGTDFRIGAGTLNELDSTSSEVLKGAVQVGASNRKVDVPAGFGSATMLGSAPSDPVALLAPPDLSATPRLYESLPLIISLNPLVGAQSYRAQIATDREFKNLQTSFITKQLPFRNGDIPDGDYWLRIRGIDKLGLEGYDAAVPIKLNARPESPFIMEPIPDAMVSNENPVFEWAVQPDVAHYIVVISQKSDFSDPIFFDSEVSGNRLQLTESLEPGHYFWRIASVSASEGAGPFSDPMPFRVPIPGPALNEPEFNDDEITLTWREASEGQSFHFQIASDEEFSELMYDERTTDSRVTVPRPSGGSYFLRIKTIESDGFEGPFSLPQIIDIPEDIPYWLIILLLPLLVLI